MWIRVPVTVARSRPTTRFPFVSNRFEIATAVNDSPSGASRRFSSADSPPSLPPARRSQADEPQVSHSLGREPRKGAERAWAPLDNARRPDENHPVRSLTCGGAQSARLDMEGEICGH
jgi:hypothetical protein